MKIIEHKWQPGVVGILDEKRGKRSYWFSAHNLFEELMDNEEAVDLLLNWSSEEVDTAARSFLANTEDWLDYDFDHEIVVAPAIKA